MILAGDVGGTKVRLALFEKSRKTCLSEQKFASREFSDFSSLLKKYLEDKKEKILAACFGIAGPIRNGVCKATNLPWEISAKVLQEELKIPRVDLINDLEANAWGLDCLTPQEFCILNEGSPISGNQALISAGTGLGEAGLYWNGKKHCPFACEGGHADFAPTNSEEIDLLLYLMKVYNHVSYERVLSGPGLYQIYRFLIDTKREKESPLISESMKESADAPRVITENATNKKCQACMRACRIFVEIYGAEAGNLALKLFSLGGVFLGGGIAPHLLVFLQEGDFLKAFVNKGRLSSVLTQIPIKVVLNDKTALLGAAQFAKEVS